jgi:hypothetical protein
MRATTSPSRAPLASSRTRVLVRLFLWPPNRPPAGLRFKLAPAPGRAQSGRQTEPYSVHVGVGRARGGALRGTSWRHTAGDTLQLRYVILIYTIIGTGGKGIARMPMSCLCVLHVSAYCVWPLLSCRVCRAGAKNFKLTLRLSISHAKSEKKMQIKLLATRQAIGAWSGVWSFYIVLRVA